MDGIPFSQGALRDPCMFSLSKIVILEQSGKEVLSAAAQPQALHNSAPTSRHVFSEYVKYFLKYFFWIDADGFQKHTDSA